MRHYQGEVSPHGYNSDRSPDRVSSFDSRKGRDRIRLSLPPFPGRFTGSTRAEECSSSSAPPQEQRVIPILCRSQPHQHGPEKVGYQTHQKGPQKTTFLHEVNAGGRKGQQVNGQKWDQGTPAAPAPGAIGTV